MICFQIYYTIYTDGAKGIIYFENDRLALYCVDRDWYWYRGMVAEFGAEMETAIELHGDPILKDSFKDGTGLAVLAFDLVNEQRVIYYSKKDSIIQNIVVIADSSEIIGVPSIEI